MRRFAAPLLLALVTGLAYANAAPRSFVYDDNAVIAQNPRFGGIARLPQLFRESAREGATGNPRLYRPLAMATLALDRSVWGENPRGFHVTSIALHVLATLAVFAALGALSVPSAPAFLAALLFGLHPIHTEVVDVAYNRSEILATLAVLAALVWIWRHVAQRPGVALGGAAVLYFAGLLCRESAVTLPALALLAVGLLRPVVPRRGLLLAALAAAILPFALYLWLRHVLLAEPGGGVARALAEGIVGSHSPSARLALVAATVRDYWRMLVWPWPLRASYGDYAVSGVAIAFALHAALAALAWACRRRAAPVTFGIAFYYVALLPSTRLLGDPATLAERFVYLPSAGATIALGLALAALARRYGLWRVAAPVIALAAVFAALTFERNRDWRSAETLWEAESRHGSNDPWVLLNLSQVRMGQGRLQEAVALCERGERLAPRQWGFASNRGIALATLGRTPEAETAFRRSVTLSGGDPGERANLARVYLITGRRELAEEEFAKAAEAETNEARRHALRGEMLLHCRNDLASAAAEFEAALALEPRLRSARLGLRAVQAGPPNRSSDP
jgi:tetratricopeptide (TPR) repeat protein